MNFKLNSVSGTNWIKRIFDLASGDADKLKKANALCDDLIPAITEASTSWSLAIMFWMLGFCTASMIFGS